jgi:transcriptional regulator with XRE-family HTH domain
MSCKCRLKNGSKCSVRPSILFNFEKSIAMTPGELGARVKERRISMGMTQSELAGYCEIDVRTVQRIEAGIVSPRFHTLKKLNEALSTEFEFHRSEHAKAGSSGNRLWLWLTVLLSIIFVFLFYPIVDKNYSFLESAVYTGIGLIVIWGVFFIRARIFSSWDKDT